MMMSAMMREVVSPADVLFDVERALQQQLGAQLLPFTLMDSEL